MRINYSIRLGRIIAKIWGFTLVTIVAFCVDAQSQNRERPGIVRLGEPARIEQADFKAAVKKKGILTKDDWQNLIDARWGPGLPTEQKLQIFDSYWNRIDQQFASLCEQVYDNRPRLPGRAGVYRHKL
jgi:hypothetical protein